LGVFSHEPTGYGNCDGNGTNGCELNVTTDNNNCGACGNVCGTGKHCASSACVSNTIMVATAQGLTWYRATSASQNCNIVCSNNYRYPAPDATVFAAQNSTEGCTAIRDAFGLTGPVSMGGYWYFSAHENIPACALENLTISRSAIVRTSLRDGVAGNRCSESLS